FLCGNANDLIAHLKALEQKYPALDRVSVSLSVGVPEAVALQQLERFAKEVMPAFQANAAAARPAACRALSRAGLWQEARRGSSNFQRRHTLPAQVTVVTSPRRVAMPMPRGADCLAEIAATAHGFFPRRGGVSAGGYASLNCGLGSKDDPAAVQENRARVAAGLGADGLITAHQVHSASAVIAAAPWRR